MRLTKIEESEERPNVCPNIVCGTLNPPGERLCRRCNTPIPSAAGQMIANRYRIDCSLATGGFGIVYRGTDMKTGDVVAIKEMIAPEPREFTLRKTFFRREAEILGMLQSAPAVPRLHQFIDLPTAAYLVLEFIPGDNLLNHLEKPGARPFPVPQVAQWGIAVCDVLEQMHRMNPPLIHRDMKPENIMLMPDGRTIRLIDFGTARELGHTIRERGVAKTKVYTEGYAPPEQVIGRPEPRSDVFALAGTLIHLATGHAPEGFFTGKEILDHLADYPVADRWFYELMAINLSEDRNDRYFEAAALRRDLLKQAVLREVQCPACKRFSPAREPYCQHCAEALSPAGSFCASCERANPVGCRFCTGCGSRLS
ncbi:serine/threonine-protein kinase [Zavarzinella formosa]|uniref:serine/threonine-protein kinase n=1 Tax=Zavarzinella formosa TaxID=360055 RepID=UPI0002D6A6FD|nr:serine/threonine-protein kinase [Zavarzinella formosa]